MTENTQRTQLVCEDCGQGPDDSEERMVEHVTRDVRDHGTGQDYIVDRVICNHCFEELVAQ